MKMDNIRIKNGKGDREGKKLTIGMDFGEFWPPRCLTAPIRPRNGRSVSSHDSRLKRDIAVNFSARGS
jgi:hypothetical protein